MPPLSPAVPCPLWLNTHVGRTTTNPRPRAPISGPRLRYGREREAFMQLAEASKYAVAIFPGVPAAARGAGGQGRVWVEGSRGLSLSQKGQKGRCETGSPCGRPRQVAQNLIPVHPSNGPSMRFLPSVAPHKRGIPLPCCVHTF